ncbi:MAG: phage BR0599 family protein [Campylobacteraceae bacterium]
MTELYEFVIENTTLRYSSGKNDIIFNGKTYFAKPIVRNDISREFDNENASITLPLDLEPAPKFRDISSIKNIQVRIFKNNGIVLFIGKALSCNFDVEKGTGTLKLISTQGMMKTQVPSRTYGTACSFRLFDKNCKVDKTKYRLELEQDSFTTSSNYIKITSIQLTDDYSGGFVEAGDEQSYISSHLGNTITLAYSLNAIKDVDKIYIYKGCKKTLASCKYFDNEKNYGGFPFVPYKNVVTEGF